MRACVARGLRGEGELPGGLAALFWLLQLVLLAAGTRLTAAHIALLRRRGVRWVKIQKMSKRISGPTSPPI